MEHLRQIEEDLRNITAEAKKRYPEVVEAADRALESLKSLRERYVSQVRKHSADGSSQPPKLPQSADILAPYLLACNYADGPVKILTISLHSIRNLVTHDLIPPDELKNILRVLHIQVSSQKLEVQLKVLQVLLQLTNSMSRDIEMPSSTSSRESNWQGRFHHINESTLFSFLTLALNLCGERAINVSVSSTAEGTATQIVNVIMDAVKAQFSQQQIVDHTLEKGVNMWSVTADLASSKFSLTAMMLVRDLCALADCRSPTVIKGIAVPQSTALRLLHDVLSAHTEMFRSVTFLRTLLQDTVFPTLISQLKHLHTKYVNLAAQEGATAATAYAAWVCICSKCLLSRYGGPDMLDSVETVVALLVQSLQPDSAGYIDSADSKMFAAAKSGKFHSSSGSRMSGSDDNLLSSAPTLKSRWEEASSIIMQGGAGAFLRGFANNVQDSTGGTSNSGNLLPKNISSAGTGSHKVSSATIIGNASTVGQIQATGFYISMIIGGAVGQIPRVSTTTHPHSQKYRNNSRSPGALMLLPSFPAAYCLDALISFLCSDLRYLLDPLSCDSGSAQDHRLQLLGNTLINIFVGASQFMQCSLVLEANMRDFELGMNRSPLQALLAAILSGSSSASPSTPSSHMIGRRDDLDGEVNAVHEQLQGTTSDVFLLSFYIIQLIPRLIMKFSLHLAALAPPFSSNVSLFISPKVLRMLSLPQKDDSTGEGDDSGRFKQFIARTCDYSYESCLDACSAILDHTENKAVVRATLGIVAEMATITGAMRLLKPCEIIVSMLCRYTVPMWHGHELYSPTEAAISGRKNEIQQDIHTDRCRDHTIRWRHYQALVKLMQVIHLIADAISDWDCIVDSVEQHVHYFSRMQSSLSANGGNLPTLSSSTSSASLQTGRGSKAHMKGDRISEVELGSAEIDKIFAAVERLKQYTIFLSDDALVKMMTSLVALSMNNLAVNATSFTGTDEALNHGFGGAGADRSSSMSEMIQVSSTFSTGNVTGSSGTNPSQSKGIGRIRPESSSAGLNYMVEGVANGTISFSLQAVIEITKLNSFRISVVWQMVISHLRMIAALKSAACRSTSVAATHDVILSSLKYIQRPVNPLAHAQATSQSNEGDDPGSTATPANDSPPPQSKEQQSTMLIITDEMLLNYVLPSFETVFMSREVHRFHLEEMNKRVATGTPQLSQSDLLGSLKALCAVRYSDVRSSIIKGLVELLHGKGQILSADDTGGWSVILELLSSVPLSMTSETFVNQWCNDNEDGADLAQDDTSNAAVSFSPPSVPISGTQTGNFNVGHIGDIPQYQWPRESLPVAFTCMKLVVDDFLEVLQPNRDLITAVLQGLALFGSQLNDVNISFTSVELLWKVTDRSITAATAKDNGQTLRAQNDRKITSDQYVAVVMEIMLTKLFQLSMDMRPEIRHCAMNTLFSAMSTHAPIIPSQQWQKVFGGIIFPLFEEAGARSLMAMRSNEEAMAPELKKGVKMSVHHSRDTAHKQWAETRVLALRGLSRVLRTSSRLLLLEVWFRRIWINSITICQRAMHAACKDQEVAVAALDVIFSMLKIIIVMDSQPPVTSCAGKGNNSNFPSQKGSQTMKAVSQSESNMTAAQLTIASRAEFEQVESSKQMLWFLTWGAVRGTGFFSCPSVDLALSITQKLTELYCSRKDNEFRYSDNIRVLLEIAVALVRPRVGIVRIASASVKGEKDYLSIFTIEEDAVTLKQHRVAENQLQRALMQLLLSIRSSDLMAECCLVSTLVEISNAFLWVEIPSSSFAIQQDDKTDGEVLRSPSQESSTNSVVQNNILVLGSAQHKARSEAAAELIYVLEHYTEMKKHSLASEGKDANISTQLSLSSATIPYAIDTIIRRFVSDICEALLAVRLQLAAHGTDNDIGRSQVSYSTPSKASRGSSSSAEFQHAGFFSSFWSKSTSAGANDTDTLGTTSVEKEKRHHEVSLSLPTPFHRSIRHQAGGSLHQFDPYNPISHPIKDGEETSSANRELPVPSYSLLRCSSSTDWSSFYILTHEIDLLRVAVQTAYRLLGGKNLELGLVDELAMPIAATDHLQIINEAAWKCLMTSIACLLSPWRTQEILTASGGRISNNASTAATSFGANCALLLDATARLLRLSGWSVSRCNVFIDMILRSAHMGIVITGDANTVDCESHIYFLTQWRKIGIILSGLCSCDGAPASVRSRSLWGLVQLTKLVGNRCLHSKKQNDGSSLPPHLVTICEAFLRNMQECRTSMDLLRLEAYDADLLEPTLDSWSSESVLLSAWTKVVVTQTEDGVANVSNHQERDHSSIHLTAKAPPDASADLSTSISSQGHLLLVLPLCVQLVLQSSDYGIRTVATEIVSDVDVVQITQTIGALTVENRVLQKKNRELQAEMNTIKSAASLPF